MGDDAVTAPVMDSRDCALQMYIEPDTWCNPLYAIGPVYDLMVEAWEKSLTTDRQRHGFAQRKIDTLFKLVKQAVYASSQDTKGLRKLIDKLKEAHVEGREHWAFPSGKELATRRLDPVAEIFNLQQASGFVLAEVAAIPLAKRARGGLPEKRSRVICNLYYFDKYRVEEAELAWRVRDAGDAAKSQLRGRERIAAFEAMWLGNEQALAYEFVGAKLPPQW